MISRVDAQIGGQEGVKRADGGPGGIRFEPAESVVLFPCRKARICDERRVSPLKRDCICSALANEEEVQIGRAAGAAPVG